MYLLLNGIERITAVRSMMHIAVERNGHRSRQAGATVQQSASDQGRWMGHPHLPLHVEMLLLLPLLLLMEKHLLLLLVLMQLLLLFAEVLIDRGVRR